MAGRSKLIVKPFRGLGKLMLGVSAKAWTLTAAVAVDTRGTLNILGSGADRDDDDRERPGAGRSDMPTERENATAPFISGPKRTQARSCKGGDTELNEPELAL